MIRKGVHSMKAMWLAFGAVAAIALAAALILGSFDTSTAERFATTNVRL